MKKNLLVISCLVGLSLIGAETKASGTNRSNETSTSNLSIKKETLSEVIQSFIKKDHNATKPSAASLTISILEDYQNGKAEYLNASKQDKITFNQTIQTISRQAQNFSDEKSLNWMKEINKSAKAINTIWAILGQEPVIDSKLDLESEQNAELVVVFKN
ncbi:hypothetical protein PQG46_10960 [Aquirufa nivalisilvae]|uniref:hypothetical protein n=1 Tax=Aquirufa nivalisilvae TaxID=2516557 RepID=UPI001032B935|nr:hypothetical protein [Aquirufa nivalisilvae]TBH73999.1 hypothetical protein EWU22_10120 [Aquirufa nivalisilvae]